MLELIALIGLVVLIGVLSAVSKTLYAVQDGMNQIISGLQEIDSQLKKNHNG
ncbi:MAG: hypothetical protein H8E15_08410 [Planctomycetes bacterium]|nr:hypothetical protein [Planctomycetota bacterium]